ncbi:MAG: CsbD family protein [Telluria sp.]
MNKDQIKGKAKNIGGKIQEKVGEVTGNRQTQREGMSKQVEGKLQEKAGDMKEVLKGNR